MAPSAAPFASLYSRTFTHGRGSRLGAFASGWRGWRGRRGWMAGPGGREAGPLMDSRIRAIVAVAAAGVASLASGSAAARTGARAGSLSTHA